MRHRSRDAGSIATTIERLCQRVEVRFPGPASPGCAAHSTASRTAPPRRASGWLPDPTPEDRGRAARGPHLAGLVLTLAAPRRRYEPLTLGELVQAIEAGVNDLVFVAVAVFFLLTLETR